EFAPGFDDAGVYTSSVTVTDGEFIKTNSFVLTVDDVNRAPTLDAITNQFVAEGATLELTVNGSDPDGDSLTFTAIDLPAFGSVTQLLNAVQLDFTPGFDDAGAYTTSVTIADGAFTITNSFVLTVGEVNRPPALSTLLNLTLPEGGATNAVITASDPDADILTVSFTNLPAFAQIVPTGNGTLMLDLQPGYFDAGTYEVDVQVQDDGSPVLGDTGSFTIQVSEVDIRVILSIAPTADYQGEALSFPTQPNLLYAIEWATNLDNGEWAQLQAPIPGTGSPLTFEVVSGNLRVYYRVVITEP
ncbi:MAG: hypothetical protein ACI9TH_002411, partial [Kiritimatiellia bacterium]